MRIKLVPCLSGALLLLAAVNVVADELRDQYAWQSQEQIRATLGEPNTKTDPVGTHAQYERWVYDDLTVTFANGSVIHVFKNNSLRKTIELNEDRSN